MTVSSIKVRLPTKFPSSVSVSSPLLLSQTGGNFAFSFDQSSLNTNLSGTYAQLANNLSDLALKYTAKDNISIHGADIASAATVNLETATGDLVDVTGTVTITAITLSEGHERTVRFTGILTLTNGASLVLPGGANITTAAGDFARFRGYAAGVVRCVGYNPATGKAVIPPSVTDITGLGTGVATALAVNTGTAGAPALVGGVLGTATATSINKVTITAPASSATLTLIDGTVLTGPAASGTVMTLGNVETVTGAKTFNDGKLILAGSSSGTTTVKATATASGTWTIPASTDTFVGKSTTDVLANKTLTTPNIGAATGTSLAATGAITSSGAAGIGYATGAGGAVTQLTSKATGVTLNTICGTITMNNAALAAATTAIFTFTNSTIAATDFVLFTYSGGTAAGYTVSNNPAAGSTGVAVRNNTAGSLSEALVLQFVVIKAVVS